MSDGERSPAEITDCVSTSLSILHVDWVTNSVTLKSFTHTVATLCEIQREVVDFVAALV